MIFRQRYHTTMVDVVTNWKGSDRNARFCVSIWAPSKVALSSDKFASFQDLDLSFHCATDLLSSIAQNQFVKLLRVLVQAERLEKFQVSQRSRCERVNQVETRDTMAGARVVYITLSNCLEDSIVAELVNERQESAFKSFNVTRARSFRVLDAKQGNERLRNGTFPLIIFTGELHSQIVVVASLEETSLNRLAAPSGSISYQLLGGFLQLWNNGVPLIQFREL
mmetsp:Transcript_1925/g.3934  ORF Transcript_1925/g.3934 Transcript_1925/m.3934 type:complete len:223 (+) Transcript_1925:2353-3021(+)